MLGRLYKAKGEISNAQLRYDELLKLDPSDVEANRESQQLAAQKAIDTGGWERQETYRDVIKDVAEAERLEEERAVSRTAADLDGTIARQQELVEKEPNIAGHYIRLGDYLRQGKRYDEAEEAYLKAKEINPTSFDALARLGDLKLERIEAQVKEARAQSAQNPADTGLKQKLEELERRQLEMALEDIAGRVQAHPTDMGLRTRLGVLYYEAGEYDKAIAEFQQAQKDPRHGLRALNYMGRSFMHKGMYELAIRRFEEALKRVEGFTDWTKELLYSLGSCYEQMGRLEDARVQYEKIYERDITYKDIAGKLEALYKQKQPGATGGQEGS